MPRPTAKSLLEDGSVSLHLTTHAMRRIDRRIGHRVDIRAAIELPRSALTKIHNVKEPGFDRAGARLWVTATSILVVVRDTVVTAIGLGEEDLGSICVWVLTKGTWPDGRVGRMNSSSKRKVKRRSGRRDPYDRRTMAAPTEDD